MIAALVSLAVPIAFAAMWLVERKRSGRDFAPVDGWAVKGIVFFVVTVVVGSVVPRLWNTSGLAEHSVLHLEGWGFWGVPVGVLTVTFAFYWYHRAAHHFDSIWRAAHQLHHSALRVDIAGAFFTHPVEVALKGSVGFLVSSALLGLTFDAASIVGTCTALLSLFQHWNIRTPRALGFLVPRPEMHVLHHEYGIHGRNYGDLALWDILFGTWANPETVNVLKVGFDGAASARLVDMLLMRDVNRIGRTSRRSPSVRL